MSWYGVRCIFKMGDQTYEERITLWERESFDAAIAAAEAEAVGYAEGIGQYLQVAQAFHLFEPPGEGAEVFSLMRRSALSDDDYVATFFMTGAEHETISGDDS